MRITSLSFILTVALCAATSLCAQTSDKLTLDEVLDYSFFGRGVNQPHSLADGEHYARVSPDGRQLVKYAYKTQQPVGVILDLNNAKNADKVKGISNYIISPTGKHILVATNAKQIYRHSFTAEYYIYDVANHRFSPLSDGGPQQAPVFSPDGNVIAFARGGDLFLVKLLFDGAETRVTKDGERGKILNGIPDWVNEEEFSTASSFTFTADSKMLAWVRYDESQVPLWHIQMYRGAQPTLEQNAVYPGEYTYKYPVAGERNASVSVMTFDIKNRVTRTMDVPMDSDGYIPRIYATSDAERLAVVTLNRHQSQMDLHMVNPRSGVSRVVLRETSDKYLRETAYGSLKFYPGRFVLLSERSGYQHLYAYNLEGTLLQTVTSGQFEVTDFYGYDPVGRTYYYQAVDQTPTRRAVFATDEKGRTRRLTPEVGTSSASFSEGMRYFLCNYSSLNTMPVYTLRNNQGRVIATLEDNADLQVKANGRLAQKSLFSFTTADGVQLNGWMVKPKNFDPSRRYPVLMYQYSGPSSQEVKDAWTSGFYPGCSFESYLADKGYICVCVDGRGTGARGADFEKCTYLKLGQLESHDQVETALWLARQPYVDADHIAIWGWSFGGFNTLMSMSEGRPVFCCGIAVAAPSSWRYYDTVYTERYMRTPAENASGYNVCPINQASNLHGNLLLIHGTADDNVHLRNASEMSEALVQADKPFEMQLYTNRNHSIYGGNTRAHLFKRMVEFLDRNMGVKP